MALVASGAESSVLLERNLSFEPKGVFDPLDSASGDAAHDDVVDSAPVFQGFKGVKGKKCLSLCVHWRASWERGRERKGSQRQHEGKESTKVALPSGVERRFRVGGEC